MTTLIQHYRNLVSALLTHTYINNEGTEAAVVDFLANEEVTAGLLQSLMDFQDIEIEGFPGDHH